MKIIKKAKKRKIRSVDVWTQRQIKEEREKKENNLGLLLIIYFLLLGQSCVFLGFIFIIYLKQLKI